MLAKRKIIQYSSSIRAKVVQSEFDTDPHWHDDCEIIAVISGNAAVSVGDSKYEAETGDVFFICGKVPHRNRPLKDSNISVLLIYDAAAEHFRTDRKYLLGTRKTGALFRKRCQKLHNRSYRKRTA